jgi:glyoxylate utilization-related uncharacterized protein
MIRDANGFALSFFRTRLIQKQKMFRSILPRTSGHQSPCMSRAVTGFRHEVRKYCVAMLDAGGGRENYGETTRT